MRRASSHSPVYSGGSDLLPRTAAIGALFISRSPSGGTARYATPARCPCFFLAPAIISPHWIGGSLPLSRRRNSPLRCVLKNESCSFRRIFHYRSLSPSFLLPFAFSSEPWLFPLVRHHGICFSGMLHSPDRRSQAEITVQLFLYPTHRERTCAIVIAWRKQGPLQRCRLMVWRFPRGKRSRDVGTLRCLRMLIPSH